MTETSLKRSVQKALKDRGAWVHKTHGGPFGAAGAPDLLVCYRGAFVALELKVDGRKPTKLQAQEIESINRAGGAASVVWTRAEALDVLDAIDGRLKP